MGQVSAHADAGNVLASQQPAAKTGDDIACQHGYGGGASSGGVGSGKARGGTAPLGVAQRSSLARRGRARRATLKLRHPARSDGAALRLSESETANRCEKIAAGVRTDESGGMVWRFVRSRKSISCISLRRDLGDVLLRAARAVWLDHMDTRTEPNKTDAEAFSLVRDRLLRAVG
eukprot:g3237.t1